MTRARWRRPTLEARARRRSRRSPGWRSRRQVRGWAHWPQRQRRCPARSRRWQRTAAPTRRRPKQRRCTAAGPVPRADQADACPSTIPFRASPLPPRVKRNLSPCATRERRRRSTSLPYPYHAGPVLAEGFANSGGTCWLTRGSGQCPVGRHRVARTYSPSPRPGDWGQARRPCGARMRPDACPRCRELRSNARVTGCATGWACGSAFASP